MEKKIIGYVCICDNRITKDNICSFDISNSRTYNKLKQALKTTDFKNIDIFYDVVNSHTKNRKNLLKLIKNINSFDILVVPSIFMIGEEKSLAMAYSSIIASGRDLLILDPDKKDSEYSSVDSKLNNTISKKHLENNIKKLRASSPNPKQQFRGRCGREIDESFIEAYWLYERFKISIEKACEMANLGQTKFYAFLKQYESSSEYLERLKVEEQKYQISKKPKRYGKIPKGFVGVIALVDKGASLESACIQSSIQPINPIDYERYRLKYFGGRKALAKAVEY